MKPRSIHRAARLLAYAITVMLVLRSASATNLYWDVNGVTPGFSTVVGAWNDTNLFWNTDNTGGAGTVSAVTTSADDLFISQATTNTGSITVSGASKNASSITFLANVGPTTNITGGTIVIGGTGTSSGIFAGSSGANTVSSALQLNSTLSAFNFTNTGAGLLTIGAVTGTAAGPQTVTVGANAAGNITLNGVIGNGVGGGTVALTLNSGGAGVATLTGASNYSGVTTINNGVLAVSTLANGGAASGIGNSANAAANLVFGAPTATLRHTGAASTTNRGFTLSSGAGGGATIEASGAGALSFDNTVAINYGTVDETRVLTLGGTSLNESVFGKVLADNGTGATNLVKAGAGTWVLNAANTYTGGSTVSAGSLVFRTIASKSAAGIHAFAAGTTLGLGVGGANFTATDVDNAFSGTMTGDLGNVTVSATTSVGIDTTAGSLVYAADIGSVTKGLSKFGTNALTLSSANSAYTGATTVSGGTLSVAALSNAGANSSIGNFPTPGAAGLILSGGTFSYTGASTTTDRGFTALGSAPKNISVGAGVNLALGASVKNETTAGGGFDGLNFAATGAGSSITISSLTITAGSNPDFNISTGNPTVTIQNLNVSGTNVIAQRTLAGGLLNVGNINGTSASGWLAQMNVTGVISGYTGTINLGNNVTLSGLSSFNAPISIQQDGIYTYNSIKNVGGGASALGAPATVANGTIQIGNFSNTPTFRYVGTGDTTDRVLNLRGAATINIEQAGTGNLRFTGNTTADATNTGANKTLNFTGSTTGTGEFSGNIVELNATNTVSVSKSGTGKWTLSGANTYTGTTTVNAGTLLINGSQPLASGAVSVSANATLGGTGTLGGNTTITDNGKLEFNLSTPPGGHDKLELASGKSLGFGANATLTITSSGGATTGLYTLITAPGGIGTLPAFTVNLPAGWAAAPPAISGNDLVINITSTGGSAYDTWKAANAPGSNPNDDTDGDGVPNAVEFVLGGTSLTRDLDKLPIPDASGSNLTFNFKRAISSIDPKTALFIETSTDLVTWTTSPSPYTVPDTAITGPPVTVDKNTPAGFDTVTFTVPKTPDARKFARLKVIITP